MKLSSPTATLSLRCAFVALVSSTANAQLLSTSPTSSATPYVRPVSGVAVDVVSFLTVGDSVNMRADGVTPYPFAGIPDGMGAYDTGNGTMTLGKLGAIRTMDHLHGQRRESRASASRCGRWCICQPLDREHQRGR